MKTKQRFQVQVTSQAVESSPNAENGSYLKNNLSDFEAQNVRRNSRTVPALPSDNARRKSSLGQLTREALPRLDHFRISGRAFKRPSLGELYGDPTQKKDEAAEENGDAPAHGGHVKLGWIVGVVIPCLLNIWGVMLFLRLSWVVGQAGIMQSLIIIGISCFVCVITTSSLSAICTNGEVKGGGIYYIISRSLGPEFGASVGIVFAFANSVAASMNTIGFCDSLNDLLKTNGLKILDNGVNDTRIIGSVALLIMVCICAVGMDWEAQAQNFLVVTIVLAIVDFMAGTIWGPTSDLEIAQGFVGLSFDRFKQNWNPDFRYSEKVNQNFMSVFAIYFPSVTGIQAGANICGDLKDPGGAIPKGTLLALAISMTSYALFGLLAGAGAARDASGNLADVVNGTLITPACAMNHTCEYGLENSYSVMQLMSLWGGLIYAGCFAATLSTALTNLLSVPRLIQALGIDRIYPGLIYFSKGFGKNKEPYRGYVLTFCISLVFLLIANLNAIAPLISTFYLASYAMINFCAFHATFLKPLGWRPTFRFYNLWVSLFGAITCVVIMFLIDYVSALITFGVIITLYLVVVYRKPDVNWGSSTQQQTYKQAIQSAYKLLTVSDHVKNYHPQLLVLAGNPLDRQPLVDLGHLITKHHSLLIVGDVNTDKLPHKERLQIHTEARKWFDARRIKAFYNIVDGIGFEEGVRALMLTSGFGKLKPNIVLMGYKSDWRYCDAEDLETYFNVLHNTFENRMALAILKLPNGLDYSHLKTTVNMPDIPESIAGSTHSLYASNEKLAIVNKGFADSTQSLNTDPMPRKPRPFMHQDSNLALDSLPSKKKLGTLMHQDSNFALGNPAKRKLGLLRADSNLTVNSDGTNGSQVSISIPPEHQYKKNPRKNELRHQVLSPHNPIVYSTRGGSAVPQDVLNSLNIFNRKQTKGTIDVWWLYDDGGLTILLPYIISTRATWANCKIRIFALTNRKLELEIEERNMANLLSKLRIDYASLVMLEGITEKPKDATIAMHMHLLEGFHEGQRAKGFISKEEMVSLREKTYRQLRLREMLLEHSRDSSLIVMSLPMPRQGTVSAPLYMSWLEMLTNDMPPFLLVRGNQQSVLTFYS